MQSSSSNRSAVRAWILYDWANSALPPPSWLRCCRRFTAQWPRQVC